MLNLVRIAYAIQLRGAEGSLECLSWLHFQRLLFLDFFLWQGPLENVHSWRFNDMANLIGCSYFQTFRKNLQHSYLGQSLMLDTKNRAVTERQHSCSH